LVTGDILDIGSKNRRYDYLWNGTVTAVDRTVNEENKVIHGDVEKGLNFKDSSFDSIICLEVLEYLDNYQKAINEIYRLLKTGGNAIITVPFMYHDHGDRLRYTEGFIKSKCQMFYSIESARIGNSYTVIWDIMRKRITLNKNRTIRNILYTLILPYLMIIKLANCDAVTDQWYSGLFLILRK
jgi:ubiquinone/menaquinone biosynthesis C-methylase UbiE